MGLSKEAHEGSLGCIPYSHTVDCASSHRQAATVDIVIGFCSTVLDRRRQASAPLADAFTNSYTVFLHRGCPLLRGGRGGAVEPHGGRASCGAGRLGHGRVEPPYYSGRGGATGSLAPSGSGAGLLRSATTAARTGTSIHLWWEPAPWWAGAPPKGPRHLGLETLGGGGAPPAVGGGQHIQAGPGGGGGAEEAGDGGEAGGSAVHPVPGLRDDRAGDLRAGRRQAAGAAALQEGTVVLLLIWLGGRILSGLMK